MSQPALASGVVVRQVNDAADAQAFVEVSAAAYETIQLPAAVSRKLFANPKRWLTPQTRVQVLFEREQAMAGHFVF